MPEQTEETEHLYNEVTDYFEEQEGYHPVETVGKGFRVPEDAELFEKPEGYVLVELGEDTITVEYSRSTKITAVSNNGYHKHHQDGMPEKLDNRVADPTETDIHARIDELELQGAERVEINNEEDFSEAKELLS
jgi:hypothetical protein